MKRYQNVSLVDLPLSPYDIIIVLKKADDSEDIIRAQVKTAKKSVPFTGGGRGGVINRTLRLIPSPLQPQMLLLEFSQQAITLLNSILFRRFLLKNLIRKAFLLTRSRI